MGAGTMNMAPLTNGFHVVGENGNGTSRPLLTNEARGDWVVCKFGGTSVGKFPLQVANIIRQGLERNRVAVVCSARSSTTKSDGSTNRCSS